MPPESRSKPPLPSEMAFVVQFAAGTEARQEHFAGRVEHIVSGQATHFASGADLLRFLERVLNSLCARPTAEAPEES